MSLFYVYLSIYSSSIIPLSAMSGTTKEHSETYRYLAVLFFNFFVLFFSVPSICCHYTWHRYLYFAETLAGSHLVPVVFCFSKDLPSSTVYFNLFNKIYLSCIRGTIITLNCTTNWNRVQH